MREDDILIIECEQPEFRNGTYSTYFECIFLEDVKLQKQTLIHEAVHHLFNLRSKTIKQVLKTLGLNFNSKPMKAMNNKILNKYVDMDFVKFYYKPEDWLEEALAFMICDADEEVIRILNDPLLNRILDEDICYYRSNGDFCYLKTGEVLGNDKEEIEFLVNWHKKTF